MSQILGRLKDAITSVYGKLKTMPMMLLLVLSPIAALIIYFIRLKNKVVDLTDEVAIDNAEKGLIKALDKKDEAQTKADAAVESYEEVKKAMEKKYDL